MTTSGNLPLHGVRVLEFGGYVAAPYATSMLAMLGAEVVKVERPGTGDDFRRGEDEQSMFFRQYNAGKKSLAIDLKRPEGVDLIKELLPHFDVLAENIRPGKLVALGLGPDDCARLNPDLVYASVTGFGPSGPLAHQPSYDSIGQAFSGLYSVLSNQDSAQITGVCLADLVGALVNAMGILAALVSQSRQGHSPRVETSLAEAVTTLTIEAITQFHDDGRKDPSRQSRHPYAQNFALPTADGPAITLHLSSSERFWAGLVAATGRTDLGADPRFVTYDRRIEHYAALAEQLADEFRRRTSHEWLTLLSQHDVPHAPVLTASEFLEHPQGRLLDLVTDEEDGLRLVRAPWRLDGERPARSSATPRVGQHTEEICAEVCEPERLAHLLATGVLHTAPRTGPEAHQ